MGEAWVDTVNNGAWDGQEDEEDRPQDNSGAPMVVRLARANALLHSNLSISV